MATSTSASVWGKGMRFGLFADYEQSGAMSIKARADAQRGDAQSTRPRRQSRTTIFASWPSCRASEGGGRRAGGRRGRGARRRRMEEDRRGGERCSETWRGLSLNLIQALYLCLFIPRETTSHGLHNLGNLPRRHRLARPLAERDRTPDFEGIGRASEILDHIARHGRHSPVALPISAAASRPRSDEVSWTPAVRRRSPSDRGPGPAGDAGLLAVAGFERRRAAADSQPRARCENAPTSFRSTGAIAHQRTHPVRHWARAVGTDGGGFEPDDDECDAVPVRRAMDEC